MAAAATSASPLLRLCDAFHEYHALPYSTFIFSSARISAFFQAPPAPCVVAAAFPSAPFVATLCSRSPSLLLLRRHAHILLRCRHDIYLALTLRMKAFKTMATRIGYLQR